MYILNYIYYIYICFIKINMVKQNVIGLQNVFYKSLNKAALDISCKKTSYT